MLPIVFISHASSDELLVSLFVDLILCSGSGLTPDNIVYTSREDTGVVNGDEIPQAIKDCIRCSRMFFMMVSEAYRASEVCLNEMGAAWMIDDLPKKIVLLPGVGFERIGWLMSLVKGTRITDEDGLDAIHDQVMEAFSTHVQTSTWNRSKRQFLKEIEKETSLVVPQITHKESDSEPDGEELDFLDYRDNYDLNLGYCNTLLKEIVDAIVLYNDQLNEGMVQLNQIQQSNNVLSTKHIRSNLEAMAHESDSLSIVLETNSPLLGDHFAIAINSAIMLQKLGFGDDSFKDYSRMACRSLVEAMVGARDSLTKMKESMDGFPDLDKTYKKSRRRLQMAIDGLTDVLSCCIRNANEIQVI